jgi:hypothetical protein
MRINPFLKVLGFGLAIVLGLLGTMFSLVGTQGMHGNEPFLSTFLWIGPVFVIVHSLAGAVAMAIVALGYPEAERTEIVIHGVKGFVIGGAVGGLMMTAALLHTKDLGILALPVYVLSLLLPTIGGIVALRRLPVKIDKPT